MSEILSGAATVSYDTTPVAPLGIIAMPGCEELGEKIDRYLRTWRKETIEDNADFVTYTGYGMDSFLLNVKIPRFGTGEGKGLVAQSARGYDVYIITDVTARQVTYKMYGQIVPYSPDDHYADLKRIIAAIGGKAYRISVIMPFLYESRQHRKVSRESMDCALMLQELSHMGVSNIITFDAHDPRVQNAIPLTGFENVMPTYQVLKALLRKHRDMKLDKEHMMIISPDEGAMDRNIYYSTVLGLDLGMFYKRRDYSKVVDGRNQIIAHEYLGDSVKGKDVLVVDDIISSGESMLDLLKDLRRRKANRVFMAATFCFFTNGIKAFEEAYKKGYLGGVIGTNLNYKPDEIRNAPWFIEADMSKYMSFIIATLNHDHSLDKLMNPLARINNLLSKYRANSACEI
ncbi:MAG: ribose-phosphate pyrophosphokinase [Clostridia bacterium]|nr:ribose-phosphate pyrophosphokinase [Clostridia bacterium]